MVEEEKLLKKLFIGWSIVYRKRAYDEHGSNWYQLGKKYVIYQKLEISGRQAC